MLEAEDSAPYQSVTTSTVVVRDRRGSFNSVELDRKLEQSIQRASKSGRHRRPVTNVCSCNGVGANIR